MASRVILITGASAGIGAACADRLHDRGWTVVGASRRGTTTGGWAPMAMDVDEDDSVRAGVAEVTADHGRLDAVLACAGWGLAGAVERTPIAEAKAQFETNFWGTVRLVEAALPTMRAQQRGRVVLVGSMAGRIAIPFQAFYTASKFALEGYAEALAPEVAPFGIHVTILEPGNFRTDFTEARRRRAATADDPYASTEAKALARMEADERAGTAPDEAAEAVERVLTADRPRLRVPIGNRLERTGLVARRLLPDRLFARAARSSLGL